MKSIRPNLLRLIPLSGTNPIMLNGSAHRTACEITESTERVEAFWARH